MSEKSYKYIYVCIAGFMVASLLRRAYASRFWPQNSISSPADAWRHLKNLGASNWIWLVSLPGVVGLIFLTRKREYVRFFLKMLHIILIVMSIPVLIGLWGALPNTLSMLEFLIIFLAVWVGLSGIGAIGMAQREYVFGGYKKDTAWRHKKSVRRDRNER